MTCPSEEKGLGFAGLVSLASNIDDVIRKTNSPNEVFSSHRGHPAKKRGVGWIVFVIGLIILAIFVEVMVPVNSNTTTPSSVHGKSATIHSDSQGKEDVLQLEKPPVQKGGALSLAQLQWCLVQEIQINTIEPYVAGKGSAAVRYFNGLVDEYNSRCYGATYKKTTMSVANRNIERKRSEIVAQAMLNIQWLDVSSSSTRQTEEGTIVSVQGPVKLSGKALIIEVQKILKDLGYYKGEIDGKVGDGTRGAIRAFHKAIGVPRQKNVIVDNMLLEQLRSAKEFKTKK